MISILEGEALEVVKTLGLFDLVYLDPPFNTGKTQKLHQGSYGDSYSDYEAFLKPHLQLAYEHLKPEGSFFLHLDYREVHYAKVWCDEIFGRASFMNEIIWHYDYGARSKTRWAAKHDNILWYAKNPKLYTFHYNHIDRIPYMAPGLVGKEKADRGKTLTDTWWNTIVPTNGKERTGYPTQKPIQILERIIRVHTDPGDRVLDFFAGSGTTGAASQRLNRECVLVDRNPEAITVMKRRLS